MLDSTLKDPELRAIFDEISQIRKEVVNKRKIYEGYLLNNDAENARNYLKNDFGVTLELYANKLQELIDKVNAKGNFIAQDELNHAESFTQMNIYLAIIITIISIIVAYMLTKIITKKY